MGNLHLQAVQSIVPLMMFFLPRPTGLVTPGWTRSSPSQLGQSISPKSHSTTTPEPESPW